MNQRTDREADNRRTAVGRLTTLACAAGVVAMLGGVSGPSLSLPPEAMACKFASEGTCFRVASMPEENPFNGVLPRPELRRAVYRTDRIRSRACLGDSCSGVSNSYLFFIVDDVPWETVTEKEGVGYRVRFVDGTPEHAIRWLDDVLARFLPETQDEADEFGCFDPGTLGVSNYYLADESTQSLEVSVWDSPDDSVRGEFIQLAYVDVDGTQSEWSEPVRLKRERKTYR